MLTRSLVGSELVEQRHFVSAKYGRLLGTHGYLTIVKVSLRVAMSMLRHMATALAHLKADDHAYIKHMTIRLPSARKPKK